VLETAAISSAALRIAFVRIVVISKIDSTSMPVIRISLHHDMRRAALNKHS
jgi:hypothetical protein